MILSAISYFEFQWSVAAFPKNSCLISKFTSLQRQQNNFEIFQSKESGKLAAK